MKLMTQEDLDAVRKLVEAGGLSDEAKDRLSSVIDRGALQRVIAEAPPEYRSHKLTFLFEYPHGEEKRMVVFWEDTNTQERSVLDLVQATEPNSIAYAEIAAKHIDKLYPVEIKRKDF